MNLLRTNTSQGAAKVLVIVIIAILCLVAIVISGLAFAYHEKRQKLSAGFAMVQKGDSKNGIVQMLGKPDEIESCHERDAVRTSPGERQFVDSAEECVEIYWYWFFLERWGFSLNRDGKVINKTYNTSY